jgi:hypothetical protein
MAKEPPDRLREKSKFDSRFNLFGFSDLSQKDCASVFRKSMILSLYPVPARGALRDRHECWARGAMDAGGPCDERG